MALDITFACYLYDRTIALQNGTVQPDGINLHYLQMDNLRDMFQRQARSAEFDACEMSFCTYVRLFSRGDRRMIAIPVFPSRKFRHSEIFVNASADIAEPKDLMGKRVGVHDLNQTAGVWQRAHLEEHGVDLKQVEWRFGPMVGPEPDYRERLTLQPPDWMRPNFVPQDKWLDQMLDDGEIDALMWSAAPPSFLRRSPNVVRLFPNYPEVEANYFRRTGIFPIMHTVVIKQEIYERDPWVAASLYEGLAKAKADAMARQRNMNALFSMVPWIDHYMEQQESVLGPDPFVYGLEANYGHLETFVGLMQEQGLIQSRPSPEEIFAPETHHSTLH